MQVIHLRLLLELRCCGVFYSLLMWLGWVGQGLHSSYDTNPTLMPNTDPPDLGLVERWMYCTFDLPLWHVLMFHESHEAYEESVFAVVLIPFPEMQCFGGTETVKTPHSFFKKRNSYLLCTMHRAFQRTYFINVNLRHTVTQTHTLHSVKWHMCIHVAVFLCLTW